MIASVSTFSRSIGATRPVWTRNGSISRPAVPGLSARQRRIRLIQPTRRRRSGPSIAAAAAIAGLTRWVRPPAPWRPSKLRLLVEAQRSPGSSRSAFIARHIEQPGSRHSKPAPLKTSSRPSRSACSFTRPGARHDHRQLDVAGDPAAEAAHHRGRLAQVLDARVGARADEDLVDADVVDRLVRLERHVLQRALDRVALAGVLLALGIGHAVVDRRDHLRRRAPGDLRHDLRRVELDDRVPVRVRRRSAACASSAPPRPTPAPVGRIRTALHVGDRRLVDADQAGARAGLDRHVADRHAAFHRERADRAAGELDRVAGAAGRADLADDRPGRCPWRVQPRRQRAVDPHQHVLRLAREQRLRRQHVLDLARADAVRERAEGAVGRGVRVAADDRHAGQRRALLRADDVDDALAPVVHLELGDADGGRSWRRACRPAGARSGRRCRASGRSSARCGR